MIEVIAIGHLGKDPEQRQLNGGKAVTKFSIGCNAGWGDRKRTEWLTVSVFGALADICAQSLRKGSKVFVQGELERYEYQTNDGENRSINQIVANKVQFLDPKRSDQGSQDLPKAAVNSDDDDDIPF